MTLSQKKQQLLDLKSRISQMQSKIVLLQSDCSKLIEDIALEESPFKVGDRVIYRNTEYVFGGYMADTGGYIAWAYGFKIKKDGTPSLKWEYLFDNIVKAEKNNEYE